MTSVALLPARFLLFASSFVGLCLILQCSQPVAGGTSTTDNPKVVGAITDQDGRPAQNTRVVLLPEDFDPLGDTQVVIADTTDNFGRFVLPVSRQGVFNIEAVHLVKQTRLLISGIEVTDGNDTIPTDKCSLAPPGTIVVELPDEVDRTNGYLYIPGTTVFTTLSDTGSLVMLESVPAVTLPAVYYSTITDTVPTVIRYNIDVLPDATTIVAKPGWKHSMRLSLNTSATGANVAGTLTDFPVLIRLNADNFNFPQAQTQGVDIRFTKSDNEFLNYEIERWDAAGRRAAIWVLVDTIFGNDNTQSITMYWGNPGASFRSSGSAVFDTANNFQGVWHLDNNVEGSFYDATANKYDGISPDTACPTLTEGMIGNGMAFNGITDFITMLNTSDSKLNFPQESQYTVSAWVFADTLDHASHLIVAKGYQQYFLRFTYFPYNLPVWEFVEFNKIVDWQTSTYPASGRQWTLLTGVRQDNSQFLYCNGMLVDSTVDVWTNDLDRDTTNDLSIGKFMKEIPTLDIQTNDGYCYFKGSIDEVRIHNSAQSPDWIRLCYMNQKINDQLVEFK